MPGLINTAMGGTRRTRPLDDDLLEANAIGYDPEKRGVGTQETVAGQMDTLLRAEGPYVTRARTRAAETANARGLINSTMAAQAGEAAAIDASLPIAGADASTYNLAARENMAAGNRAFEFGAGESNISARQAADAANQTARMRTGAELERGLIGARTEAERSLVGTRTEAESRLLGEKAAQEQRLVVARGDIEKAIQGMRGEQGERIANIEANYRQLIQTSDSAGRFYAEMARDIGAIMANKDTSREQKTQGLERMADLLESGLTIIGEVGNIDLASLLDFSPTVSGP